MDLVLPFIGRALAASDFDEARRHVARFSGGGRASRRIRTIRLAMAALVEEDAGNLEVAYDLAGRAARTATRDFRRCLAQQQASILARLGERRNPDG